MSPRPPLLSGRQLVKIFQRLGYREVSQKGSHIKIRNDDTGSVLIIPDHNEVDRWTLRTILKQAEIPEEHFREQFREYL
ncbi:MAG TPA: type II toxin-antitoxin system HicA family toxin [Syntrophobacteria bacterium]|nr:type II toxin-antitoxin system HicA family toxin [Syntrophobacteria bacterium]